MFVEVIYIKWFGRFRIGYPRRGAFGFLGCDLLVEGVDQVDKGVGGYTTLLDEHLEDIGHLEEDALEVAGIGCGIHLCSSVVV